MNCTAARDTFAELLDSRTPATALLETRSHLASCPDCQRDFSALRQTLSTLDAMPTPPPSPRLRQNFYAMLEEEKNSAASVRAAERRAHRVSVWRWVLSPLAACALLAVGFYAGLRRGPAPGGPSPSPSEAALRTEVQTLNQKVDKMSQVLLYSYIQQQQGPVSDRLQKVLAAAKDDKPSDQVLTDLVSAVAFDPSVNVRLRALEALYPHAESTIAREGVRVSLPREQDPLVQLEMIDFLAAAHDREATSTLETIAQNEAGNANVREAARRALAQL